MSGALKRLLHKRERIQAAAAAGLALCLCPSFSSAQVLRVTTRLVEVRVVAQTRQGEPAANLTQDDFTVLDEGHPQRIAFFRTESSSTVPGSPPRLPPNVFSNRGADVSSGATVILFDGLNTQLSDQAYARQQILKFLQGLQPGDRVALYVMGRGPRVLQDFTPDATALVKALASYKGGASASLDAPLYDPAVSGAAHWEAWLGELSFRLYDYYGEDRAFRTIRALIAIANHLESLPGRKNLIWVSGSFPVSLSGNSVPAPRKLAAGERQASPEVERAARALNRANLAIYPVDARGLMAAQEYVGPLTKPELRNPDTSEFANMQTLADRTGGRAFYNNNDLTAALRRAADDSRFIYVLGYYPSHKDWKGKFHKIEVQVRRPDVEIHYRRGYFAQSDEPADSWYRQQVLDSTLWSPVDATALGLTVAVRPAAAGGLDLALQLGPRDIAFERKQDKWACDLDLWLVQLDQKERQCKTDAHTNNLMLDQATYDRVMQANGLMVVEHVNPAPEAMLLRILVRDVASGALGSLTVPLGRFSQK
ncbi:MAG TPA: VWA domain-containing protein [Bryobacteraceae bacterium]|nr:VWA domain-containing protein [Bryobacteraceae bacterium]